MIKLYCVCGFERTFEGLIPKTAKDFKCPKCKGKMFEKESTLIVKKEKKK